jgi:hypothetical protein
MTWVKNRINALRLRLHREAVINDTVKTMRAGFSIELQNTPREQWDVARIGHAQQIAMVRAGIITAASPVGSMQNGVVDRRSINFPYMPLTVQQIKQPIIKQIPYTVRQFSRTPVVRRAMNMIKSSVVSLDWTIEPIDGAEPSPDQLNRIQIAKNCLQHPNDQQSYQTFMEMAIEELCVNGSAPIEMQLTPSATRPFKMWVIDASTIRIFPDWKESLQDQPRFAQMTGLKGERGIILFYDDELMYLVDNPAADTPFGTSKVEIAYKSINALISVQDMSSRAGADQIHKTWLWWTAGQTPGNIDIVRRHIANELEGQSRLSLVAGMQKPEVIEVTPVTKDDLLLEWQEMCVRMIGNGFDMSATALGIEKDINRAVGEVLSDQDFRSAVVPMATKFENDFTKTLLHRLLGYKDLQFKYVNMDDRDPTVKMQIWSQLYAMNGGTANEIRVALGKPKLTTPLADLTQIELTIVYSQLQADIQNDSADKAATRQVTSQKSMMDMQESYGQLQNPAGGSDNPTGGSDNPQQQQQPGKNKSQQGAAAKTVGVKPLPLPQLPKGVPAPKTPQPPPKPQAVAAPPKGPMAGSKYSAAEVAGMSPDEITAEMAQGNLPNNKQQLSQNMQQQDPFILTKLTDELKEYFAELNDDDTKPAKPKKATPQQEQNQKQKFKQKQHVQAPAEENLQYLNERQDKSNTMYKDRRKNPDGNGKTHP